MVYNVLIHYIFIHVNADKIGIIFSILLPDSINSKMYIFHMYAKLVYVL